MRPSTSYDEPYVWWGPVWSPPPERTVIDLIRGGVLSTATAALLWAYLARRASLIVVAGPRGAGKTTVLTALLDLLPSGTRRIYLRGCYESFTFLDDPTVEPERTILLVNEISAHLPVYLWGPGVRRLFAATRRHFAVAATAHASSVDELIGQLAGYPLRVPLTEIAAIDLVVVLDAEEDGGEVRRAVTEVWGLRAAAGGGLRVEQLAAHGDISLNLQDTDPTLTQDDITNRRSLIDALATAPGAVEPRLLRAALARYDTSTRDDRSREF